MVSPIAQVEYLTLDGVRYAVREGRFTRSHLVANLDQFVASRGDSPFLDGLVTGFGGGIKPEQVDDRADWVADALALEPAGAVSGAPYPLLRIGRALAEAYSAAGAGVLRGLASDAGWLFAGEQGASQSVLRSSDGATWSAVSTGSGSTQGVSAIGAMGGYALAGFPDVREPWLSANHGASWAVAPIANSGPLGLVGTALILPVAAANDGGGNPAYWIVVSTTTTYWATGSAIRLDGGVNGAAVFLIPHETATAGCSDGGTAYICGANTTEPIRGQVYAYTYAPSADVTPLAPLDGNYATAMAFYDGAPWLGCAARGEVYRYDGSATLAHVRSLPTTLPIRGMRAFAGALWVLIHNDAAARLELHRYDAGGGWSRPHVLDGVTLTAGGGLAPFGGRLYAAAGNGTTRKVYAVSDTQYAAAASVTLPDAVYGAPSAPKRYRRVELQHGRLFAGQSVAASYSLDGEAYASLGTNARVGSTRTAFELPDAAIGGRLAARFDVANDPTRTLALYGGAVRALPAPDAREVWEADLILDQRDAWGDAAADGMDSVRKFEALAELHDGCAVFEALDPFRDASGLPRRAMRAVLDVQVPFGAAFDVKRVAGVGADMPIRLIQAAIPENLVQNSSFELDAAGSHPTGWTLNGTATAWYTADAAFAVLGARVLTLEFDGVAANVAVEQVVAGLVAGRYYTVSGYLRRVGFAGSLALRVHEGGTQRAITVARGAGTDAALTRDQATFLLPAGSAGTVTVQVLGTGTPTGVAYADCVMLEEGAPASTFRERGSGT